MQMSLGFNLNGPRGSPQEFPSEDGARLLQQVGQDQMAVAGETRHGHHHAEDDHLQHGDGYEQTAEGNQTRKQINR